ncbi:hypothetical protein PVK06_008099 [Gossypium arboreum]|uniref:Uncharacterized protein n=1 Tax=Gossypium arboreum TaxID=29729 RepID=A0ABR0QJ36_GOSAR|nr:hypothetical protein PVK06_008099 [Gossypium arboreum]
MANGKPFIFQGHYMMLPEDVQPESSRWQWTNVRPRCNRVPPFENTDTDSAFNLDPEPQYKASGSSSYHPVLKPQIPLSFEDIFGDDPEPQHSTHSESSSYHSELDRQERTPTIEDIFPSTPLVTQYLLTLNYGVYDYTTFLSTSDGTPNARLSNYEMPQQGARHCRWS